MTKKVKAEKYDEVKRFVALDEEGEVFGPYQSLDEASEAAEQVLADSSGMAVTVCECVPRREVYKDILFKDLGKKGH